MVGFHGDVYVTVQKRMRISIESLEDVGSGNTDRDRLIDAVLGETYDDCIDEEILEIEDVYHIDEKGFTSD